MSQNSELIFLFGISYMQACTYCLKLKPCLTRACHHLDDDGEDDNGDEHHDEGIDEPGDPVDSITQPHYLHHLLQTILLLVDNTLTDHGNREHPGQHQKQGQGARYSVNKSRINTRK